MSRELAGEIFNGCAASLMLLFTLGVWSMAICLVAGLVRDLIKERRDARR